MLQASAESDTEDLTVPADQEGAPNSCDSNIRRSLLR